MSRGQKRVVARNMCFSNFGVVKLIGAAGPKAKICLPKIKVVSDPPYFQGHLLLVLGSILILLLQGPTY